MAQAVIQDTWTGEDDQELYEYMNENKIPYVVLSEEEILKLNPVETSVLFCDTIIFQRMVPYYTPPDTYAECFRNFYRRKIQKMILSQCSTSDPPYFVKPSKNNKQFNAIVVNDKLDLQYVRESLEGDDPIYVCDVVNFVNEFRMFVLNHKLYGIVESSHYILDSDKIKSHSPPSQFINEILEANIYRCVVIDIGMLDDGTWAVVEVNPPFSLSSYDLPIDKYFKFCQYVWALFLMKRI